MDVKTLENALKTENRARLYFRKKGWKKRVFFCTRRRRRQVYRIANKRYRCKRCGYMFHDFTGRWLSRLRVSYRT